MKKNIILFLLISLLFQVRAQVYLSLNEFDEGEYLAVKQHFALLISQPNQNSIILDTITDCCQNLIFKVIQANSTNGYVKVKVMISKWASGVLDSEPGLISPNPETGLIEFPYIINDGKVGWIDKNQLLKHPIPDDLMINIYDNDEEFIHAIIKNLDFLSISNKVEYSSYKSLHAKCNFILGKNYFEKDSSKKAIYYLTKSLKILPKNTAYTLRALAKMNLEDYQGAIADCNKGILLNKAVPSNKSYDSYLSSFDLRYDVLDFFGIRGFCQLQLKNFNAAISDLNIAIKNDDENGKLYYYRGIAKFNLGQNALSCQDFSKAGELGIEEVYDIIQEYCK